ncbi:MAG: bifunctional DNA-formamidopyrimidine glycosylase/DNA-(apurinic or apyrimidinic site) lyase [Desulfonatronovibrionaceae bacterium]
MPELPEVETIARYLNTHISGKVISDVFVFNPGILRCEETFFTRTLLGAGIVRVFRRAKLLVFVLDNGYRLIFHLKMTGRMIYSPDGLEAGDKPHLGFALQDGSLLCFQDQRKFGYCALLSKREMEDWDFYAHLGPEPLEMSQEEFVDLFFRRRAKIKALLLDQKTIAGVGNIYADEALFEAKVPPNAPSDSLGRDRLAKLFFRLQDVLKKAIQAGGSTFRDYIDASGRPGRFQEQFAVYGRKDKPCPKCSSRLKTMKVAGRTSTYCPHCQCREAAVHERG